MIMAFLQCRFQRYIVSLEQCLELYWSTLTIQLTVLYLLDINNELALLVHYNKYICLHSLHTLHNLVSYHKNPFFIILILYMAIYVVFQSIQLITDYGYFYNGKEKHSMTMKIYY